MEALRLLAREDSRQILMVTSSDGALEGIVTKTDILRSFQDDAPSTPQGRRDSHPRQRAEPERN
jgi:CBS domain-containing protein